MYNRYIPQADGSYRRSRIEDSPPVEIQEPDAAVPLPEAAPVRKSPPADNPPELPRRRPIQSRPQAPSRQIRKEAASSPIGITGFLRQLIPPNLDAEDLIVVLLLLLMSGESQEDQNGALLTLALYLFL